MSLFRAKISIEEMGTPEPPEVLIESLLESAVDYGPHNIWTEALDVEVHAKARFELTLTEQEISILAIARYLIVHSNSLGFGHVLGRLWIEPTKQLAVMFWVYSVVAAVHYNREYVMNSASKVVVCPVLGSMITKNQYLFYGTDNTSRRKWSSRFEAVYRAQMGLNAHKMIGSLSIVADLLKTYRKMVHEGKMVHDRKMLHGEADSETPSQGLIDMRSNVLQAIKYAAIYLKDASVFYAWKFQFPIPLPGFQDESDSSEASND